ncbi:MAG: PAS domain S-box protein [Leptolyngbya sp. SIO4C1]|nr:PAS domain S-box protein [Leptolyngbya sp. SIO4C1]
MPLGNPDSQSASAPAAFDQALRESEERFRATFDQAAVGIAHVAPDGRWLRVNHRLCEIVGYTSAELQATTFQAITHPDDLELDLAYVRQMLAGKRLTYSMEKRYFHKSGEIIWINLTVSLVRERSGEPKYFISVVEDISDRKQTEASLKASEDRFRRAIVQAPVPIVIYAEDGEILHLSEGWTRFTGYTASDIPTLEAWTEKAYDTHKSTILQHINQLFERDRAVDEGEFAIRTQHGTRRIWQFSSAPLGYTADGRRLVISMASDVSQLKRAESTLAQKLNQQAAVAKLGQQALKAHDPIALFTRATELVAQALEIDYCKVLELTPDRHRLKLVAGVGWQPGLVGQAMVKNDQRSQAGYTLQANHPVVVKDLRSETRFSGPALLLDHQVVSGISVILYQQEDEPFGVLGAHTRQARSFSQPDIDFVQAIANILSSAIEQHQARATIQQMNRSLEQRVAERTRQVETANDELKAFAYTVSHDLRAPLRAMQGFAQALLEDYAPELDELGHEYANRIVGAAAQMDTLILDLLDYSRLGRAYIQLQPLSLDQMMTQTCSKLAPIIQNAQAEIQIRAPLPEICGNRHIVFQILTNLLTNGIKFIDPQVKPVLQISCEERDRTVRLWVKDNGIGIAPKHQQRIFQVFERLHGIEAYGGTGIGLAAVKRGVERLGGAVGVESVLGQGSRFWVDFLKPDACQAASMPSTAKA